MKNSKFQYIIQLRLVKLVRKITTTKSRFSDDEEPSLKKPILLLDLIGVLSC